MLDVVRDERMLSMLTKKLLIVGVWRECAIRARPRVAGTTLFELLVVITVMVLVMAIALPGLGEGGLRKDLHVARDSLFQTIRYAQQIARAQSTLVTMTLDGGRVTLLLANDKAKTKETVLPRSVTVTKKQSFVLRPDGTVDAKESEFKMLAGKFSDAHMEATLSLSATGVLSSEGEEWHG